MQNPVHTLSLFLPGAYRAGKMNEFNILCPTFQEAALCHPELDVQLWPELQPLSFADWLGQKNTTQMKTGNSLFFWVHK